MVAEAIVPPHQQFDGMLLDNCGNRSGHRSGDDLEEHQGSPVGDAEPDGDDRRKLGEFDGDILDARVTRWVFPFATTFLIFIVLSNYVDLVPGVGSIGYGTPVQHSLLPFAVENVHRPFFRPPTTDANLTVAMAGVFLVMSLFWAVRYNGVWGLIKHIFGVKMKTSKWVFPLLSLMFLFIGVMEVVSILFARPVALAMRLYGNIFAGETMMDMTFHMKSLGSWPSLPLWLMVTKRLSAWCRRLYLRCWSWRLSARCARTREEPGH